MDMGGDSCFAQEAGVRCGMLTCGGLLGGPQGHLLEIDLEIVRHCIGLNALQLLERERHCD